MKGHFCPICGIQIIPKYQSNIYNMIKNNSCCKKCGLIKRRSYKGENNPFFGKKHTDESKNKKIMNTDYSVYKTDEFKEKMSAVTSGKNNGMYGKSVYEVWVEKYGVEEANRKMETTKNKWRLSSSGSKNPMYGKPSPKGCGAGWCGWYKGYFFRSLHELAFLMKTPLDTISSAEGKEYAIKYTIDGAERNYFADYIMNNDTMVEIKPIALQNIRENVIKKKYAEEYCLSRGMKYIMVDCGIVDISDIKKEIETGNIILTERTKIKFDAYIK